MLSRMISKLILLIIVVQPAFAEERSLLILHTNDLHDHVRADYDGTGGLAYVSGYIAGERERRDDILLLDAGDVMEKGDLAVFRDQSRMMYQAMGQIGFDAAAPGNHDDAYGDPHLLECVELARPMRLLAVNMLREDGGLLFPASHVFERNGLRIGVMGVFRPRDDLSMNLADTARAVAIEAARLESETDLLVVVAHLGPKDCAVIAAEAPGVDVFVSGHTHQALRRPLLLEESGALLVQAGSYAEYVGRLELTVDDTNGTIVRHTGDLVEMNHATVEPDEKMQQWFATRETELSPEAVENVATTENVVGFAAMAQLGAAGVRKLANADIGFCHTSQIIRAALPSGPVDINAVFRTGGQRGYTFVESTLSGAEIAEYVEGLANSDRGKTVWSGFRGRYESGEGGTRFVHDLDPAGTYKVVMPEKEWDTRFVRYFRESDGPTKEFPMSRIPHTFTEGVVSLIRTYSPTNTVQELADLLAEDAFLPTRID